MKFSCADFTFPLLSYDKVLDLLKLLDFNAVDIGLFEGRSHHYPSLIAADPAAAAEQFNKQLAARDLVPSDVFIQTGTEPSVAAANSPDKSVRAENRRLFTALVDFTVRIGSTHITGLPGVSHAGTKSGQDWGLAVEENQWRVTICEKAGLLYAVEPHLGSIISDPQSTLRLLDAVSGLTLTLDCGHFIYQSMSTDMVLPLVPHASHFHARGGAAGALQTTVKDNRIDFAAILNAFKKGNYQDYLCLEYVWIDWEGCNRTDNLSETILLRAALTEMLRNRCNVCK